VLNYYDVDSPKRSGTATIHPIELLVLDSDMLLWFFARLSSFGNIYSLQSEGGNERLDFKVQQKNV